MFDFAEYFSSDYPCPSCSNKFKLKTNPADPNIICPHCGHHFSIRSLNRDVLKQMAAQYKTQIKNHELGIKKIDNEQLRTAKTFLKKLNE